MRCGDDSGDRQGRQVSVLQVQYEDRKEHRRVHYAAVPVAKLDRAVLSALADKVLTPERLEEMLRELKARLKKTKTGQDDHARVLQRELSELEQAILRLYEAVEKGILPI